MRLGWVRTVDFFRPISRRISETVQDKTNVTIKHYNKKLHTRLRLVPKPMTN